MSRSTQLARRRAEEARLLREQAKARRRRLVIAGSSVGAVLLALTTLVVVKLAAPSPTGSAAAPASTSLTSALAGVPASVLDSVARGTTTSLPTRLADQPPLTGSGKPLVLYVGAEYCPFCAAQRWGLIVALSRFGHFDGLQAAHSAYDDVYPGTATLSFHGSSYTSDYLAFQGVELATSERQGGSYGRLDTLNAAQLAVLNKYDAPPYVPAGSAGAVPFVDFGNHFVMSGSTFSPDLLSGLTHEQIAAALADPGSPVARAVLGSANAFTAVLCELTGGKPANVCGGAAVRAYADLAHVQA